MVVNDDLSRRRSKMGMAIVETVIVLPFLLMMVFAIAEFSILFNRWQTVTNAAREGARTAVVYRAPCVEATVIDEVRTRVRAYTAPTGIVLTDAQIVIEGVCGTPETNARVEVTVPYQFRVLGSFAPSVASTINAVGNSVMRNEGSG